MITPSKTATHQLIVLSGASIGNESLAYAGLDATLKTAVEAGTKAVNEGGVLFMDADGKFVQIDTAAADHVFAATNAPLPFFPKHNALDYDAYGAEAGCMVTEMIQAVPGNTNYLLASTEFDTTKTYKVGQKLFWDAATAKLTNVSATGVVQVGVVSQTRGDRYQGTREFSTLYQERNGVDMVVFYPIAVAILVA